MGIKINMEDNSRDVLRALHANKYIALEAVGFAAESNVKILTPVRTGRLKESISHVVDDNSVEIGTNVEYARYVETNDRAYHPNGQAHYLRDGITRNIKQYESIIKSKLTVSF